MWFDPPSKKILERDEKRMREIQSESADFEAGQIDRWLDFADKVLNPEKKHNKRKVEAEDRSIEVA